MSRYLVALAIFSSLTLAAGTGCGGCDPVDVDPDAGGGAGGGDEDAGEDAGEGGGGGGGVGGGTGGGVGGGTGGGSGGGTGDGGCGAPLGGACANSGECCSGFCAPSAGSSTAVCQTKGAFCKGTGDSCADFTDCCSGSCVGGTCALTQCKSTGSTCASGSECCTQNCAGTTCAVQPNQNNSTRVLGESCDAGVNCASTLCQNFACAPAGPCQANNDVCGKNNQCCGNNCSVNDGGSGYCVFVTGGGAPSCKQDFNPCQDLGDCCTRTCVDLGSGAKVCAPATGCKPSGDFCTQDQSCCGGGTNPNGTVSCTPATSRCDNGNSCVSPGQVCGNPTLLDGGVVRTLDGGIYTVGSTPVACCRLASSGATVDSSGALCHLDGTGVPRCVGGASSTCPLGLTGQPGCCVAAGNVCAFADQCCNGVPCIPNPDGGSNICATPNSCLPVGTACTPSADAGCCSGTDCRPTGELSTACLPPPTSSDAGVCKVNGDACTAGVDCCSKICAMGPNGTLICTPEPTCRAAGQSCTASADCCTGTACEFLPGQTTGVCGTTTGCIQAGQTCTAGGNACCTGLNCNDTTQGGPCGPTGICACIGPIN